MVKDIIRIILGVTLIILLLPLILFLDWVSDKLDSAEADVIAATLVEVGESFSPDDEVVVICRDEDCLRKMLGIDDEFG